MADYAIHDTTLTGIADTIRKKDGTQALIDPADYADRINLMGMLEEKTISGAVASCSDGADDVPLSSWTIDVNPTLSGKSQIIATKTKKNQIDISGTDTDNGYISGRWLNSIGAPNINNDWYTTEYLPILPNVEYTISGIAYGNQPAFCFYDETKTFISGMAYSNRTTITFTSPNNAKYVRFSIRNDFTSFMLEFGSTATTYEPFVTPVTNTVNLGQTIYGGQADVVNGTGTEEYVKIVFDGSDDEGWGKTNAGPYYTTLTGYYKEQNFTNGICDSFTMVSEVGLASNLTTDLTCSFYFGNDQNRFYIRYDAMANVDDFKTWLSNNPVTVVYKVATATPFTFTPITPTPETYLNSNCFWGDTGDSEVVYRSSGTITPVVPTLITKSITENGTYNASSDNADGYSSVTVAVQPNVGTKSITENGTYAASGDSLDGYSSVTVEVPTAPSGMFVMDFTNISSPFTLNGVSYGSTGAVFDNTSDYIDLPFFHAGMEIEIDVASISLGQNANRRFFSSYRNQGFLYRNSNVWSFYNGSWYDTNIADSAYFDNSTVKIVVDANNYWHIYKDDVLIFEPAGACAISEPAIGSKDGSCINNATITGVRIKEVTA